MARILLDTNIIIHREASRVINRDIGKLFNWFDNLGDEKWVHHLTIEEINGHSDPNVVTTMQTKIQNYNLHTVDSADDDLITTIRQTAQQ